MAEDGRDLGADQLEDVALALCLGQGGELRGERAGRRRCGGRGARTRPLRIGGRAPAEASARRAARSSGSASGGGAIGGEGGVEQREALLVGERLDAAAAQPRQVGLAQARGHPLSRCQRPQAIEVAGRPSARRLWARASRKALAAA